MFKVGDEVCVRGKVTGVDNGNVKIFFAGYGERVFKENDEDLASKTYGQGLADAWELAKKIVIGVTDGGFESRKVIDAFGKTAYYTLKELTYEEALAKIEEYEREKEIKVGDVVRDAENTTEIWVTEINGSTFGGIKLTPTDELGKFGGIYSLMPLLGYKKTGKHIDIESLLRQIGE